MSTIIRICGVALIGLVAVSVMRGTKNELSGFISAATGLVLLGSAIGILYPIISYICDLTEGTDFSLYIETILKSLGVAVISESAADICRDSGEGAIASKVEFAAKALIIYMGLPVVKSLLTLAFGVLEK
ncbi:MAG: SpoIIIAC/SpoIIIAD family protein [Eubacteriales bacterium]